MRRLVLATVFALAPTALAQPAPNAAPPAQAKAAAPASKLPATVKVRLTTNDGVVVLELDRAKAPISVENFLQYVKDKHFEGTIFHRVIPGFVIQGGGYTAKFEEKKTRGPIKLEAGNGLSNVRGSIAMARTADPNSATAQFYINLADNGASRGPRSLDTMGGGYAVFGMVVEGMDVVDRIAAIPTGPGGPFSRDVPFRNAMITKVEVLPPAKVDAKK